MYEPAIPLLGLYLEKIVIQNDACTPIFTLAVFTIDRTWTQPTYPTTEEWIKKLRCIHTVEHYSARKRNETVQTYTIYIHTLSVYSVTIR